MKQRENAIIFNLYTAWCVEEFNADCIYDEVDEDFTDPRFIAAERKARDALFTFLDHRTTSVPHILLKLQVACDVEDFLTDAMNPACRDIAPRAVVGAMRDLEGLTSSFGR